LASTHDETANLAISKLDNRSHVVSPSGVKPEEECETSKIKLTTCEGVFKVSQVDNEIYFYLGFT